MILTRFLAWKPSNSDAFPPAFPYASVLVSHQVFTTFRLARYEMSQTTIALATYYPASCIDSCHRLFTTSLTKGSGVRSLVPCSSVAFSSAGLTTMAPASRAAGRPQSKRKSQGCANRSMPFAAAILKISAKLMRASFSRSRLIHGAKV